LHAAWTVSPREEANKLSETADDDVDLRTHAPRSERQRAEHLERPPARARDEDRRFRESRERDRDDTRDEDGIHDGGRRKSRWPLVILVLVLIIAGIAGITYWLQTAGLETTDDAYTEGNAVSIAPKISGYVTQLNINDNTYVKAGQPLLTIDPREYVAAVDQARANLQLAQYQLASAKVDLEMTRVRAPATLDQAQAQLTQAQANQVNAQREYHRQHAVSPQATTQQSIDQANTQLKSQTAAVTSAEAQVRIAGLVNQTVQAAEDSVNERQAQVAQAQANLEQAQVNLSYTDIRAPEDGWITQRNVDKGSFVQAGQQVFYIVTPQAWVVANFKENQLARIRRGQQVTIDVDAYPKLRLRGHVDSIQAGSGARFSAFPAENATGNFVKIVRRVPVKIDIDSGLQDMHEMPLGLSVEPTVKVR
jgi:membrane fusion protein, multidrug efflux system